MISGYTPKNKRRPPCYGCENCVMITDRVHTAWVCKGTPRGRELYSFLKHSREYRLNKEQLEENLKYRVMRNQRPKWCPEEQRNCHA